MTVKRFDMSLKQTATVVNGGTGLGCAGVPGPSGSFWKDEDVKGRDPAADATLDALLATGAGVGEALGHVAATFGPDAVRHRLAEVLRGTPTALATAFLDDVACGDADLAQWGLARWLEGRNRRVGADLDLQGRAWVTALPLGLVVEGRLWLQDGCLAGLPGGLQVKGDLWLMDTPLAVLPDDLKVGGRLDMGGCRSWDGRIPRDAKVKGRVFTDAHRNGIPLKEWHRLHPHGERTR
jgi:hypothetical protein